MQTEDILFKIHELILSLGGIQVTSNVGTELNQDRKFTMKFSVNHEPETPLLDKKEYELNEDQKL